MLEMIDPSTVRALALPLTILLSYKVSSSLALRNWIAVSQLPTPAQFTAQQSLAERQAEAKSIKKRKWIVSLACIAFVAFELLVISKASQFELDGFFSILTAVMTNSAVFALFARFSGAKWSVHRLASGALHYRYHQLTRLNKANFVVGMIASLALTYFAVFEGIMAAKMFAIGALIVSMTSRGPSKTASIRKMTIFLLAYEALIIALSVALIYFTAKDTAAPSKTITNDLKELSNELEQAPDTSSPAINRMMSFLIPSLYAAPVGHYIGILLRFDYHQSSTSLSSSVAGSPVLETTPAPVLCSGRSISTGVVIPRTFSLSTLFGQTAHPYYRLSTTVTFLIYAVLVPFMIQCSKLQSGLTVEEWNKLSERVGMYDQVYCILALFITLPVLALSVGIMAKIRGEKKQMWTYEEKWILKPASVEATGAIVLDQAEEEEQRFGEAEKPLILVTAPEEERLEKEKELVTWEEVVKA